VLNKDLVGQRVASFFAKFSEIWLQMSDEDDGCYWEGWPVSHTMMIM